MIWQLKFAFYGAALALILTVYLIEVGPKNESVKPPQSSRKHSDIKTRCTAEQRASLLNQMCGPENYTNEIYTPVGTASFADEKHRIFFCALPKTGVSSWKTFLMKVASEVDEDFGDPHNFTNLISHGITPIQLGRLPQKYLSYYKVLEVRHPFTRLILAYKDKIFNTTNSRFCKSPVKGGFPTWAQFAEYVANRNSNCTDRHWLPYNELCPICKMEFDAVTKLETLSGDVEDFVKSQNISDELHFDKVNGKPGVPEKTTEDYMRELPEEVLSKLKKMFHMDMKLFGYHIHDERLI